MEPLNEASLDELLAAKYHDVDDFVQAASLLANAVRAEEQAFQLVEFKPETFLSLSSPPSTGFYEVIELMKPLDECQTAFKLTLKSGFGDLVKSGQKVLAHYEMYFENQNEPFDSTVLRDKPSILKTGRGELLEGLEDAILSMKVKEISKFIFKWQSAFGEIGCPPRIPPKADICCFIEVVKIIDLPQAVEGGELVKSENDFEENFKMCEEMLNEGKALFVARKFDDSIRKMKDAFYLLETIPLSGDNEQETMETLSVRINVNLAAMYNHCNKPEMACTHCQNALRINPTHKKALFNYGRANIRLKNFALGRKNLNLGLKHYPNDASFIQELNRLKDRENDFNLRNQNLKDSKNLCNY